MGNLNLAIRCEWREIEWVDGGAHMRLRRPRGIKGGTTLIFDHLLHLQTNTHLYALLLSKSSRCLATNLSRGRFNLYFRGTSVPTLVRLFYRSFREVGTTTHFNHQCREGIAYSWVARKHAREVGGQQGDSLLVGGSRN